MMELSRLRTWSLILLIVLAIGMTPWPRTAMAITPQSQTVHIIDTHDDGFVTEAGIGIDSALIHILDPGMDIVSFLVFREIDINYWEPLKNATLKLRTSNIQAFDADSSVTIYGISLDNLQLEGWLGPAFIMSAPLTGAYVNVNTSQFYGQAWHEIDVTNIVEELIRHYNWDGDGHDGTETGDAIGFIILGAEDETRYFYDYRGNPSLSADLVIHWNHEPPPPSGYEDAEFNETYRGYDIWFYIVSYGMDFNWVDFTEWHEVDQSTCIDVVNSTFLDAHSEDATDNAKTPYSGLHNHTLEDWGARTFSWKIYYMDDGSAGADPFVGLWSMGETALDPGPVGTYVESNEAIIRFGLFDVQPLTDDEYMIGFVVYESGALWFPGKTLMPVPASGQQLWTHIEWNMSAPLPYVKAWTFNNSDMTGDYLLKFHNLTSAVYWPDPPTAYSHEHLFQTEYYKVSEQSYAKLDMISYAPDDPDIPTSEDEIIWIVTDENGTTIADDLDDYDDAIDIIEDELGADPQDPDPPAEDWPDEGPFTRFNTRGAIFIVGFFMFWGTIWFFSWKRPDGYYLLVGALVIIMGVGLIIHSVVSV